MNRSKLENSIREHEGYRQLPYRDHLGNWTIGTGHLIEYTAYADMLDNLVDPDQHELWFRTDVESAIRHAALWAGDKWDELTDDQREVLAEMHFQLGAAGMMGFVKFREAVQNGDVGEAVKEMLDSKWAKFDTPQRARALADKFKGS